MPIFALNKQQRPLMPCSEKQADCCWRETVVVCRYPFTIRLKNRHGGDLQPIRLKIDPGSQGSGIAQVRENGETHYVIGLFELNHRGFQLREALQQRAGFRRRRRSKNLR